MGMPIGSQYFKSLLHLPGRHASYQRRFASTKVSEPLHVLFCGSEEFSIASLQTLHKEHQKNPELIASIDVVCRPAKRVGRNLKLSREVPISTVARELSLPLHQIDTFTGWKPPKPQGKEINIVIAVSFGLFVPPRILSGAKYGGLNVHPSMLPDFRGPAPLHHTLLCNEKFIGLTLQTLDPLHFDQGEILSQSEYPGFKHECETVQELLALVAPKGADMLLKGLNDRVHVPPRANIGWQQIGKVNQELRFAPKITPEDRHINWNSWSADRILRTSRVIGPLWNIAKNLNPGKSDNKRIIWTGGFSKFPGYFDPFLRPGRPAFIGLGSRSISQPVFLKTCDGHVLAVDNIKIEGAREMSSWDAFQKVGMIDIPSGSNGLPQDFAQLQVGLE